MVNTASIETKVILHSITPERKELLSIESYTPYFLDAEIEKHGELSSNSSSNRAIPFDRMSEADFFIPEDIRLNQSGMQGFVHPEDSEINNIREAILDMRNIMVGDLSKLSIRYNIHKQHLNRYLAPWSMQRKIITATREAWYNVLALRNHPDADPSIQDWARKLEAILLSSHPTPLKDGEWHLPYVTQEEKNAPYLHDDELLSMSAARCARTSYNLHDGAPTTREKDVELFHRLVGSEPRHLTPLTHQALNCSDDIRNIPFDAWPAGVTHIRKDGNIGSGNFSGFIQFRHYFLQTLDGMQVPIQ